MRQDRYAAASQFAYFPQNLHVLRLTDTQISSLAWLLPFPTLQTPSFPSLLNSSLSPRLRCFLADLVLLVAFLALSECPVFE